MWLKRKNLCVNIDITAVLTVQNTCIRCQSSHGLDSPYTKFEFPDAKAANNTYQTILTLMDTDIVLEIQYESTL